MNKVRSLCSRLNGMRPKRKKVAEEEVEKTSPITEELNLISTKSLDYPLDRNSRMVGKIKGLTLLQRLVRKIEKEKIILSDTDLRMLLRCSLHTLRYVSQKADRGEYLMRNWVDDAKFCVEKSISTVEKGQIQIAIYYLLRYFQDEDRWHSCDMAIRAFKDFMQIMGEKYIENVEEDILSIFLNHMALFCPGTAIGPSLKVYPLPDDPSKLKNLPIKKNPLPPMSRIIHAMLYGYQFKSMDYRVWSILDTLFNIYINVVKTCEHVRTHPKQTPEAKRIWREWDTIECALLGSLRNFLDNIIFYDIKCKEEKETAPKPERKKKKSPKKRKVPEVAFGGGEALTKVMAFVLDHALDNEVPLSARNKLLDMLINATKTPPVAQNLSLCLPDEMLDPIIQIAMSGDPGSALRSHRLLHHLIDRHGFRADFQTPRIFSEKLNPFSIEIDPADWEYMKENRKSVYSVLFWNFLSQTNNRINLEALYRTLCLMLVELQSLYFARDIAELLVNIQDLVITNPDIPMRSPRITSWIHATVISVLSLIVLIHDMKDLRKLVFEVVNRRSQVAPFLLPPLKVKYTIGDISDFQDDLFFSHSLVRRYFNLDLTKQTEGTVVPEQNEETEGTEQAEITEDAALVDKNNG